MCRLTIRARPLVWIGLLLGALPPPARCWAEEASKLRVATPGSLRLRAIPADVAEEGEPAALGRAVEVGPPEKAGADGQPSFQAIRFAEIEVGRATSDDVLRLWGKPVKESTTDGWTEQTYVLEPFERIIVSLDQQRVVSIVVRLPKAFAVEKLVKELRLERFEPVEVVDAGGARVGIVFPDCGVALGFQKAQDEGVSRVVFDAPNPEPFLLRAERRAADRYSGCLHDTAAALELDPKAAQAHALRAQVLLEMGRVREALDAAESALREKPRSAEYRLLQSRALAAFGQYDRAIKATEQAIVDCSSPEGKARAVCQLGDQVAAGSKRDYKLALDYHMQAIKLAEPLSKDPRPLVARSGWETLFAAHLGAARDIAWGDWKQKPEVASRWLEHASALAGLRQADENQKLDDSLELCRQALDACVGLGGKLDPAPWLERLEANTTERLKTAQDPFFVQQLKWQRGTMLYDALQIYQQRGDTRAALEYGRMAASQLEQALASREGSDLDHYLLARVYFRLGSLQAVANKNHVEAVIWFNKGLPTLSKLLPTSAWADPGRQGETLVSMAVSYWAVGEQEKALQLTRQGLQWMEKAVTDGMLARPALAVAYANLATMHGHRGESDKARGFQEMAQRAKNLSR